MAGRRLNPFGGPVKVYVKAIGETSNDPVSANAAVWTGWTLLGWKQQSDDGLTLEVGSTAELIKTMGYTGGIQKSVIGESVKVGLSLKETDWEAIAKYALPGATYTAGTVPGTNPNKIGFGGAAYLQEFSIGIEGYSPTGQKTIVYLPRVTPSSSVAMTHKKGDTAMPYSFEALSYEAGTEGEQMMIIYEITVTVPTP